jgi:benzoylformate decarboxylase
VLRAKGGPAHAEAAAARLAALEGGNWSARRRRVREQALAQSGKAPIAPDWLMAQVVDALPKDAVVVNEALTSGARFLDLFPYRDRYDYHANASGGIGWALPAAVGIQLAQPDRPVVALVGDGSAMYTIQGLWTAAHLNLPVTFVIANNKGYRILKQRLLAFHGNDKFIGMDFAAPEIDFAGLARSFGLAAERIVEPGAVRPALDAAIASRRPTLLDVVVEGGVGK